MNESNCNVCVFVGSLRCDLLLLSETKVTDFFFENITFFNSVSSGFNIP